MRDVAMIEVTGFSKSYGDFTAVRNLDFAVKPGEILGLVGANGAGKTTTLRTLSGIIAPTSGRLSIAGHDIVGDAVGAKRRLGYVPDDPRLFDTLTARQGQLPSSGAACASLQMDPHILSLLADAHPVRRVEIPERFEAPRLACA